ncbi:MAG: Y-family DNA polymerase [Ferruginibacter sp.]
MKAIIDCNNFYCSCERLFLPHLDKQPVVVLSNNDGCIISRSDEAKRLGVEMAGPYFKARPLIRQHNVAVFSSNYNLYGDMSWRVMETLRSMFGKKKVEVYSVDEAFVDLDDFKPERLQVIAAEIKDVVELWTGIKVSVGVAPTKVLAKLANNLAKKDKLASGCITILDTKQKIDTALRNFPVQDIWGVGRQYAKKLKDDWAIFDAYQLSRMSESFAKAKLGGVVGVRLVKELRGEKVNEMEDELLNKKMIATTRMFGSPVTSIHDIKEAVATYTSRAAEKLRRQNSAARTIGIFVIKKEENHNLNFRGASVNAYRTLPVATSFTNELIKPAVEMVEDIFEPGKSYKKAGVLLSGLVPDESIQGNLFKTDSKNSERKLMEMIDNINFSQRDDVLKFAASGTDRNWKMRQELRSPRYTTRWDELFEIK